jgi:hypothetical protein
MRKVKKKREYIELFINTLGTNRYRYKRHSFLVGRYLEINTH